MMTNTIYDMSGGNQGSYGKPISWRAPGNKGNKNKGGGGGNGGGGSRTSGGGRSSGSGGSSSSSGNTAGGVSGGGNYTYNPQATVDFNPLPNLPSLNPEMNRLQGVFNEVDTAYDPTAYLNSVNELSQLNLTTGLQAANTAATAASNNAAQQGGAASSSVLRAQLLLPFLQQNAALKTQGQEFASQSRQAGNSASAQIASQMAGLRNDYIGTLANYNAQNASNRLNTQELNFNIRNANNTGRYNQASFVEGQRQFDNNYNLQRRQFQQSQSQFDTSTALERERLDLARQQATTAAAASRGTTAGTGGTGAVTGGAYQLPAVDSGPDYGSRQYPNGLNTGYNMNRDGKFSWYR